MIVRALLAAALLASPCAARPSGPGSLKGRSGFFLLPFEAPAPALAARLPESKALLWPLRAWLLDRGLPLVTSIHRDLEGVRRDARREGLDTLLLPTCSLEHGSLVLGLRACDARTGTTLAASRASRRLPMGAGPAEVEALLPGLAEELYAPLFR